MKNTSNSSSKINFAIGGQAILEGVMMRSPHHYVMAVRAPDHKIVIETRTYVSLTKRSRFWALPIVRGVVVLGESLTLGMKALFFSNEVMMSPTEKRAEKRKTVFQQMASSIFWLLYFVFVLGFTLFLFKFLPLTVAQWVSGQFAWVAERYWLFNLVDGFTKIFIFVSYILLISLSKDIRRVFAYHGAEHQAIWAYEKDLPLTIENAQHQHPEHPRCGTSFIILVLLTSVLVYTILPSEVDFLTKLLQRIAVLPLLAGLSYEVLKLSAKYERHWWMRWVTLPGIWLQKVTTKKPTDDMEEVAIAALAAALEAEKNYSRINFKPGNVFNADRDNAGKGIHLDKLL